MNRRSTTVVIAESGIMIALSWLLSLVKVFSMPQGGSITLGSMIPIVVLALRRGPKVGIGAGAVLGVLRFVLKPSGIVHPVQWLLDYPVAFGLLGLAGFFAALPWLGALLGVGARMVSHTVGGAIFFAHFAPEGMNPWIYSVGYNISYLGIEAVIAAIILALLPKRLLAPAGGGGAPADSTG